MCKNKLGFSFVHYFNKLFYKSHNELKLFGIFLPFTRVITKLSIGSKLAPSKAKLKICVKKNYFQKGQWQFDDYQH
jgi:hypothetical protein